MLNEQNLKSNSDDFDYEQWGKINLNQNVFNYNISFPMFFNNNIFITNNNLNNNNFKKAFNYNKKKSNKKISPTPHLDIYLNHLENLLKKENCIDINIFQLIKNDFFYLIKTQNGNKLLQNYLPLTSTHVIHLIFL